MLRKTIPLIACCVLSAGWAGAQGTEAEAAGPTAADREPVEVTLFLGLLVSDSLDSIGPGAKIDFDEDLDLGLIVGLPTPYDRFLVEVIYSRHEMELTADRPGRPRLANVKQSYLHVGGHWELNDGPNRGFATASAGAVKLNPGGTLLRAKTLPSVSVGGGGKFFVSDHVAFRVEGRLLGHVGGSGLFCSAAAGCLGQVSGSLLMQFQAAVGLTLRF